MKYEVSLLNWHSNWIVYCNAQSQWEARCAMNELQEVHKFEPFQVKCVLCENQ